MATVFADARVIFDCENNISIDNLIEGPAVPLIHPGTGPLPDVILEMFLSPKLRKTPLVLLSQEYRENLRQSISGYVEKGEPLSMVFQTFSFKVSINPLKTNRLYPDMGELSMLQRLRNINATVQQVYPPGMKFDIILEGRTIGDIYDLDPQRADAYTQNLTDWLSRIKDTQISATDLGDLVRTSPDFSLLEKKHLDRLLEKYADDSTVFMEKYISLINAQLWNLDTSDMSHANLKRSLINGEISVDLLNRACLTTCRYLAFYSARNDLKIIQTAFPDAIWASVIITPDRLGIHPVHHESKLLPYHGVPIKCRKNGKVFIAYLYQVQDRCDDFVAVYCKGDKENTPFYYRAK